MTVYSPRDGSRTTPLGTSTHTSGRIRVAKRQNKAGTRPQAGPQSSPLAPSSSGLSPQVATRRRASLQLPAHQIDSPASRDSPISEATDEENVEIETPTRLPPGRIRPASAGQTGAVSRLSLPQSTSSSIDASNLEKQEDRPPPLRLAHTSPETHGDTERRRQRPSLRERLASDPSASTTKLTGSEIDRKIADLVLNGPKNLKKWDAEGNIYIFITIPKGDGDVRLMKVGITEGETGRRGSAIKGKCRHTEMREHPNAVSHVIPCYAVAEKLIHAELENFRHHWLCKCKVRHKEYFDVSDEIVLDVFSRWRDFCQRKPWDDNGNLLPEWRERLRQRKLFDDAREDYNHQRLALHWRIFTTPIFIERLLHEASRVCSRAYTCRWMIAAVVELFFMVFAHPTHMRTKFFAFIIFILCLLEFWEPNLFSGQMMKSVCNGGLQSIIFWLNLREVGEQDKMPMQNAIPKEGTPREAAPRETASSGSQPRQTGNDSQLRVIGSFPCESPSIERDVGSGYGGSHVGGRQDSEIVENPDIDEDAGGYDGDDGCGDDDDARCPSPSLRRVSPLRHGSMLESPTCTRDDRRNDETSPQVIDLTGMEE